MVNRSPFSIVRNEVRESFEYVVYTFQRTSRNQEKWQLSESFDSAQAALDAAKGLYESGQFTRVEVKEKYTNIAVGKISDTTIKVFERKSNMPMKKFLTLIGVEV